MHFHHLHFYVRDAAFWRDWFIRKLAFQSVLMGSQNQVYDCEVARSIESSVVPSMEQPTAHLWQGGIEIWLSEPARSPSAADYLQHHPPGLVDVAFASEHFDRDLKQAIAQGATLLSEVRVGPKGQRQCQLKGWADLRHTLVEVSSQWLDHQIAHQQAVSQQAVSQQGSIPTWLSAIDHVVINVPAGELVTVAAWYQRIFGLESGQRFDISTAHSGLRSQVLVHPEGTIQLPINEPSSANSQIQEFLNQNRGAGVQHVALRSHNAVSAIAHFRQQGLALINVPQTYYDGLNQRSDCPVRDTSAASEQQLLLDWAKGGQQGLLMQTFTKPIFAEPTFFFEVIERGTYLEQGRIKSAQGFGEGNFQALFEAIERAQLERGTLR